MDIYRPSTLSNDAACALNCQSIPDQSSVKFQYVILNCMTSQSIIVIARGAIVKFVILFCFLNKAKVLVIFQSNLLTSLNHRTQNFNPSKCMTLLNCKSNLSSLASHGNASTLSQSQRAAKQPSRTAHSTLSTVTKDR